MHHHGSDTLTSPRAVLHHTDANLCTILHTTVTCDSFWKKPGEWLRTMDSKCLAIMIIEIQWLQMYLNLFKYDFLRKCNQSIRNLSF